MNKTLRFGLTAFWVVFSRAYDAYCTHQFTPDLQNEANPLVAVFGMGWTPLLLIVGGLTLFTVYTYYLRTYSPSSLLPKDGSFFLQQFVTFLYLGRKNNWSAIFYKLPTSLKRFNQYWGAFMMPCLVFAGIVSTIMWVLMKYMPSYAEVYHSAPLIYTVLMVGAILIIGLKSKKYQDLYRAGKSNHFNTDQTEQN